jgi:hypothetical protein
MTAGRTPAAMMSINTPHANMIVRVLLINYKTFVEESFTHRRTSVYWTSLTAHDLY